MVLQNEDEMYNVLQKSLVKIEKVTLSFKIWRNFEITDAKSMFGFSIQILFSVLKSKNW